MNEWKSSLNGLSVLAMITVVMAFASGCVTAAKPVKPGKYQHVGFVWLKEPGNLQHQQRIIDAAHAFAREIPEVQWLSAGKAVPSNSPYVDSTFDVCIVMQFEDEHAFERYNKNPTHLKAAQEAFLPLSRKILFYNFISE